MPRTAEQIEGNEYPEIVLHLAQEEFQVLDSRGVWHPARWLDMFGRYAKNIQNEICGLATKTRNRIQRNLPPGVTDLNEFRHRKMRPKVQLAAEAEEKKMESIEDPNIAQRIGAWLQRNIGDKFRDTTLAERTYFEGDTIADKRANIEAQITAIAGVTMIGGAPINFGLTTLIPAAHHGMVLREINWLNMSLWDIEERLQATGHYDHIASQDGYTQFTRLRRRLDNLNNVAAEVEEENIATSIFDAQRLRTVWDRNQYNIQADLAGILDTTYNFNDPALMALISRMQADRAHALHYPLDPIEQQRLEGRFQRARELLGQGNQELTEQNQRVADLETTVKNLEAKNGNIDSLLSQSQKQASDVQGLRDPNSLEIDPTHPPLRFANIQLQIDYYQNLLITQYARVTHSTSEQNDKADLIRNYNAKLEKSQERQKKINEVEETFRNTVREFLDIFRVDFRECLITPPALLPFPGPPLPAGCLQELETSLGNALADPAVHTITLANLVMRSMPTNLIDNLKHEIGNTRGAIPNDHNFRRRMAIYIEDRKNEKDRQSLIRDRMKEEQKELGTGPYSARDILLAYEKASIEDRGTIDQRKRDLLAVMAVDKQILEIEKAQEFIPFLNQELGQHMARGFFGRLINRLDFLTYDEYDLIKLLANYTRTHRKLLKNIHIGSSVDDIQKIIDDPKNNLNYAELPIIWKSIYEILRTKKIKGVAEEVEIQDSAWAPIQQFVSRLHEVYLRKKNEDMANKLDTNEKVKEKHTPAIRLITALEEQNEEIKKARATFEEDIKNLSEWLTKQGRSVYDWVFGREGYRQRKLTDLQKKGAEALSVEEKGAMERFGVDLKELRPGDLTRMAGSVLMAKELWDQGKNVTKWLGLSGEKKGSKRLGLAVKGAAVGASKSYEAASWAWSKGTNAVKGGLNILGKGAKGLALIPLLPFYVALNPWKSTKWIGKKLHLT